MRMAFFYAQIAVAITYGLFCIGTANAAQVLKVVKPPCETESENACMKPFEKCEKFFNDVRTQLKDRHELSFQTAMDTGIDMSFKMTEDQANPKGSPIGETCDLDKSFEECPYKNKSVRFRRSGKRIRGDVYPGSGELLRASFNGLFFKARDCYWQEVLKEAEDGGLKITSFACLEGANDIEKLVNQTAAAQSTHLSSVGTSVAQNFCQQDVQLTQAPDIAKLCQETPQGQSRDFVRNRIASCKLHEAGTAIQTAFTFLLACEAMVRTEQNYLELTYGRPSEVERIIRQRSSQTGWAAAARSKGKSAKKAARRGKRSKAKRRGNQAAAIITAGFGKTSYEIMQDLGREHFTAPNCRESTGLVGASAPGPNPNPQQSAPGGIDSPSFLEQLRNFFSGGDNQSSGPFAFFGGFLLAGLGRRRKRGTAKVLTVLAALSLAACSGGGGGSVNLNFCATPNGIGQPHCCSGGNAISPPPEGCGKDLLHNADDNLDAMSAAVGRGASALNDLTEMNSEKTLSEYGGTAAAAVAVNAPSPPVASAPPGGIPDRVANTGSVSEEQSGTGRSQASAKVGGFGSFGKGSTKAAEGISNKIVAKADRNDAATFSGGKGKATPKASPFTKGLFGKGKGLTGGSSKTSEVGFGADRSLASEKDGDPIDYFTRINILSSLFKVVTKRYRKESLNWALSDSRRAALAK